MFTGIIETTGVIAEIVDEGTNKHFCIRSSISSELKIDQSISHDGVCLTVTKVSDNKHWVTAILETLSKTSLEQWNSGSTINLERCLKLQDRLDGHLVQGHVDTTMEVLKILQEEGSTLFFFELAPEFRALVVPRGSVCLNGISLTVARLDENQFAVAIIPYTLEHTNFKSLRVGNRINVEFDILGKYIHRYLEQVVNS